MTAATPSTGAAGAATSAATAGAGGAQAPASISGTATFASNANGVNLTVMVSGCQSGKEYPIHVHQGGSCESAMAQGGHWDMTRGEGIPNIVCGGRAGATMVSRPKTDMTTAWSVGDGSATDVVGHVVVIHDADDPMKRIACGVIAKN
jgi:Cu/Zn superoxide dismutase